MIVERMN
jgi:hypothetical protein